MDITQYSTFVSLLILGLLAATFTTLGGLFFKKTRELILAQDYFLFVQLIGAVAIISTLGALTYQYVYSTEVCILCWWQRIWMFPIEIMVGVSLWYRVRVVHLMTLISSAIGIFFAGYHYYYHFLGFVLGRTVSLPCDMGGLLPACTDSPILIFGFITIPFMALVAFLAVLVLSVVAHIKFIGEDSKI